MITLKKDRELIRLEHWSALEEMPGFMTGLDPNEMKLKEIIGRYSEHGTVKCGLKNCGTPHTKGYVVVTTTGNITNIGNVCGKKYFSVDFETMSSQLNRDLDDQENRETLNRFITNELDDIQNWVEKTKITARSLNSGVNALRHGAEVPQAIRTKISDMVRKQTNQLTIDRSLTEEEKKAVSYSGNQKKSQFRTEIIAVIDGIEALYPKNDLKTLLVDGCEMELNQFQSQKGHVDQLHSSELKKWVKWIGELSTQKQKIKTAIELGRELFSYANLIVFEKVLDNSQDVKMWKAFLKLLKKVNNS